jgi:hypothetical protein
MAHFGPCPAPRARPAARDRPKPRRARHPHRVVDAGQQEDQRDLGILQKVFQRIEPVVARPVGERDRVLVQHLEGARRIAARGDVLLARGVGGGDQAERREGDEAAHMDVDAADILELRAFADGGVGRDQRGGAGGIEQGGRAGQSGVGHGTSGGPAKT